MQNADLSSNVIETGGMHHLLDIFKRGRIWLPASAEHRGRSPSLALPLYFFSPLITSFRLSYLQGHHADGIGRRRPGARGP